MPRICFVTSLFLSVSAVMVAAAPGMAQGPVVETASGNITAETRIFSSEPAYPGQRRHSAALALDPEFYLEWEDYTSLTVAPFVRLDSADPRRSHVDMREFYLQIVRDDWELGVGVSKLFWGVVESYHLVDIVNQTDLVESPDLEEKLGQPMVNLTLIRDWGFVDVIYMPWFRERTFAGRHGRLRSALPVEPDLTDYESAAGQRRADFAARYTNSFGDWDVGVYHFHGTSREPSLRPALDKAGRPVLAPLYEVIHQTGADVQYTTGPWLWKLEALYRSGQRNLRGMEQDYAGFVGGVEYTFYSLFGGNADLGLLAEYLRDTRGAAATIPVQNDIFAGARLGLNDAQDTAILGGVIQDMTGSTRIYAVEASRRLGESWRLAVELRLFTDTEPQDPFHGFRNDDFIQVELGYYF